MPTRSSEYVKCTGSGKQETRSGFFSITYAYPFGTRLHQISASNIDTAHSLAQGLRRIGMVSQGEYLPGRSGCGDGDLPQELWTVCSFKKEGLYSEVAHDADPGRRRRIHWQEGRQWIFRPYLYF